MNNKRLCDHTLFMHSILVLKRLLCLKKIMPQRFFKKEWLQKINSNG